MARDNDKKFSSAKKVLMMIQEKYIYAPTQEKSTPIIRIQIPKMLFMIGSLDARKIQKEKMEYV